MTQTIDHATPAAANPAPTRRTPPWWCYLLAILLLGSPMLIIGGIVIASESHKSEAGACQKMIASASGQDIETWYRRTLIPAAPNGSNVQDALYAVYGFVGKGKLVPDATWARLSTACTAVGVDIG